MPRHAVQAAIIEVTSREILLAVVHLFANKPPSAIAEMATLIQDRISSMAHAVRTSSRTPAGSWCIQKCCILSIMSMSSLDHGSTPHESQALDLSSLIPNSRVLEGFFVKKFRSHESIQSTRELQKGSD